MIKMDAVPLISVGKVKFGMTRTEVRKLYGEFSEFQKSAFSKNTTDAFSFCHVYYDNNDCCEAVEIFDAEIYMNNQLVFPCKLDQVKEYFPNAEEEYGSYLDKGQSIGLYIPDEEAESILFGAKGYYL